MVRALRPNPVASIFDHIKEMLLYFEIAIIKRGFEFNQTAMVSID